MNVCFLVASTYDRIGLLNKCIRCFKESRYSDCDVYLYFQGDNLNEVDGLDTFKNIVVSSSLRGVFTPRYELLKRFGINYDYVVIIDDDLFILPETDYFKTIDFIEKKSGVGCVFLSRYKPKVSEKENKVVEIVYPEYCNMNGGIVMPNSSVKIVLDYFADKEMDYTEDMFWLLLWVKGLDLFNDYRSMAKHVPNRKTNGKFTGYSRVRLEKKYVPILPEYFYDVGIADKDELKRYPAPVLDIKSLANARPNAFYERERNKKAMVIGNGKKP